MRSLITLALLAVFLSLPVLAQDVFVPRGIAISQAPEAGLGICFGADAEDTIACSRAACAAESGSEPQDCLPQLWCAPHGWIADIFMQHEEGNHWHSYICDASSREELDALIAVKCGGDYLLSCGAVTIWDWNGVEYAVSSQ